MTAPAWPPSSSASPSTAPSPPAGSPCSRLLVLASAGLTTGLLHDVLDIDGFAGYPAGAGWPDKVGGTVAATVLGLTSLLLLIPAGFGYVLIMLVREAALLVLTATAPIAAAGALSAGTRAWLWKSLRWFLAACLTAPLLALVLGLGVQITRAAFPDTPPAPEPRSSLSGPPHPWSTTRPSSPTRRTPDRRPTYRTTPVAREPPPRPARSAWPSSAQRS